MSKKFEENHRYEAVELGYDPIKVIKRTAKSIKVTNGRSQWMMRIRIDENGDEFVVDSSVPSKWRDSFLYKSIWEVK